MRLLFAGSPALAVPSLERLVRRHLAGQSKLEVVGVLTNPDTAKGRSGRPTATAVGEAAKQLEAECLRAGRSKLTILKPPKLDGAAREAVTALRPDLLVSVAYGRIFGPRFLSLFLQGGINLHPSLLPRYRGATPIPAVILAGDSESGVTVQRLAPAMDSGDILAQERWPLSGRETTESLSTLSAVRGAELVVDCLEALAANRLTAIAQDDSQASYCGRIEKSDGLINWSLPAVEIDARIRAFWPWPLAYTEHNGQFLVILEARPLAETASISPTNSSLPAGSVLSVDKAKGILVQTGNGILAVSRLQYGGKKALDWCSFLNGARDFIGARLGSGETEAGGN